MLKTNKTVFINIVSNSDIFTQVNFIVLYLLCLGFLISELSSKLVGWSIVTMTYILFWKCTSWVMFSSVTYFDESYPALEIAMITHIFFWRNVHGELYLVHWTTWQLPVYSPTWPLPAYFAYPFPVYQIVCILVSSIMVTCVPEDQTNNHSLRY